MPYNYRLNTKHYIPADCYLKINYFEKLQYKNKNHVKLHNCSSQLFTFAEFSIT